MEDQPVEKSREDLMADADGWRRECDDMMVTIMRLESEKEDMARENAALLAINDRQSGLLTRVANALRGEPVGLSSHGHADLPDRAATLVEERRAMVVAMSDTHGDLDTIEALATASQTCRYDDGITDSETGGRGKVAALTTQGGGFVADLYGDDCGDPMPTLAQMDINGIFFALAKPTVLSLVASLRARTAELEHERKARRSYEDGITWGTSCLNCARLLAACLNSEEKAEGASREGAEAMRTAAQKVARECASERGGQQASLFAAGHLEGSNVAGVKGGEATMIEELIGRLPLPGDPVAPRCPKCEDTGMAQGKVCDECIDPL